MMPGFSVYGCSKIFISSLIAHLHLEFGKYIDFLDWQCGRVKTASNHLGKETVEYTLKGHLSQIGKYPSTLGSFYNDFSYNQFFVKTLGVEKLVQSFLMKQIK